MDKIYLCREWTKTSFNFGSVCTFEYTRTVYANKTFITFYRLAEPKYSYLHLLSFHLYSWIFCAIGNYQWLGCDLVAENYAHFAIGRRSVCSKGWTNLVVCATIRVSVSGSSQTEENLIGVENVTKSIFSGFLENELDANASVLNARVIVNLIRIASLISHTFCVCLCL